MKPSHINDAQSLIDAGAQELALVPRARAIANGGGPPFEASLHIHIAVGYARAARQALKRAERELAREKAV